MIEVENLLAEVKVIDEGRSAGADTQRVLVIGDWTTLGGRENIVTVLCELMKLAAFSR